MWFDKVKVPTTEVEFNVLVNRLCGKYQFFNREHVECIVINEIQHMPRHEAKVSLSYLANCVTKNMSYNLVQAVGSRIKHTHQIQAIMAELRANPLNQQAVDALEKAANEGSIEAQTALEIFRNPPHLTVVPPQPSGEDTAHVVTVPEPA